MPGMDKARIELKLHLSRRVRLRLWRDRKVDRVAFWLLDCGHEWTAVVLWKVFGLI